MKIIKHPETVAEKAAKELDAAEKKAEEKMKL